MAETPRKKKIVRAEPTAKTTDAGGGDSKPTWTASPEAKKSALTLRLIALGLWLLAIGGEAFAIFVLLRQQPVNLILLIAAIVVIGALAIGGSLLWKRANRLDPASRKDPVRFFVQNQLGAIIAIVAFLPLIVLVLTNKNMDGRQKAIAGSIGVVVAAAAVFFGADFSPPSVEQYSAETNIVQQLTGENVVYWTASGSVFHVCADVPDVNKESADGQIFQGTVADAHAAGKDRLTLKWESEARTCGYSQEQIDAVKAGVAASSSPAPAESGAPDDAETATPAP